MTRYPPLQLWRRSSYGGGHWWHELSGVADSWEALRIELAQTYDAPFYIYDRIKIAETDAQRFGQPVTIRIQAEDLRWFTSLVAVQDMGEKPVTSYAVYGGVFMVAVNAESPEAAAGWLKRKLESVLQGEYRVGIDVAAFPTELT